MVDSEHSLPDEVTGVPTQDDLIKVCGLDYQAALPMVNWKEVDGVSIPFASPQLLWKTKQTHREKDALDRSFLRTWFADHGMEPPTD